MPAEIADMMPEAEPREILVLLVLHRPPGVALARVIVWPLQALAGPVMKEKGFTVIVYAVEQLPSV